MKKDDQDMVEYPMDELLTSIGKVLNGHSPVNIKWVSDCGDVCFSVAMDDLGISSEQLHGHPFYRTNLFANLIGELLVRQEMGDAFAELLLMPDYETKVGQYKHDNFGFREKGNELTFHFHVSLLYDLLNEALSLEPPDETKDIKLNAEKDKREMDAPKIISWGDKSGVRIKVNKGDDVLFSMTCLIVTLLKHYGITDKHIHLTSNMFSFELEATDKTVEGTDHASGK